MVGIHILKELREKGQIVIPKEVRDYFGLKKGSKVIFEIKDDEIIIKPQPKEEFLEIFCSVVKNKLTRKINIKELYYNQIEERNLI